MPPCSSRTCSDGLVDVPPERVRLIEKNGRDTRPDRRTQPAQPARTRASPPPTLQPPACRHAVPAERLPPRAAAPPVRPPQNRRSLRPSQPARPPSG